MENKKFLDKRTGEVVEQFNILDIEHMEEIKERNHGLKDTICEECGKPWASEYHISDVCVNLDEDGGIENGKEI